MKKIDFREFYHDSFSGSDLQKIYRNNVYPMQWEINNTVCHGYNADLMALFGLPKHIVEKWEVKPNEFAESYKNGYLKGKAHLRKIEKIKIEKFDNPKNKESIIKRINSILFEREFINGNKGILATKEIIPYLWTEKKIHEYGYYNGIMKSIDDFCKSAGITHEDFKKLSTKKSSNKSDLDLEDYFRLKSYKLFISDLKIEFKTEKGKDIKAIIEILKQEGLLHIPNRGLKAFIEKLKDTLNRDIGTYQSINDPTPDKVDIEEIRKRLNPLIKKQINQIQLVYTCKQV